MSDFECDFCGKLTAELTRTSDENQWLLCTDCSKIYGKEKEGKDGANK